jgi:single-stranded DNA-binding protein
MISGIVIGRIARAGKIVNPGNGKKPFLATTVVSTRHYNGNSFDTYCDVLVYGKDIDQLVHQATEGALACASGELSANGYAKEGKNYANPKIVGQLEILSGGAPKAAPAVGERPARTTTKPATTSPIDDEDVPF